MKEEAKIVQYIVDLMSTEALLTIKTLRNHLIKDASLMEFSKNFNTMSKKNLEHYRDTARLFYRLKTLLISQKEGTENWTDNDYQAILATGIHLCNCLKPLNSLSDKEFLNLLKEIVHLLPTTRERLKSFVFEKCNSNSIKASKPHDLLRDHVATKHLQTLSCQFVSTEVVLENRTDTSRGLKIDTLGWKADGKICGIEVKTKKDDDIKTKKDFRYDRYIKYCNEFYILTPDYEIFTESLTWRNERHFDELGIILCDIDSMQILHIEPPRQIRQEVTNTMLRCVQSAVKSKLQKLINTVYLEPSNNTPDSTFKKLKDAISKEFIDFLK